VSGWVFFSGGKPFGQLRALLGDEESRLRNETTQKGFRRSSVGPVCELLLRGGYGKSSSSVSRAKERDRQGASKRLPRAARSGAGGAGGGLYGDFSGEDVKIH
jgi:hypothetical protein